MPHGPEEHLEHAEHAQHAAHDPFDRRVAMTMAIVAAVLACGTMLNHREHTETLRLQNEANTHHTEASNQWNYYQSKKNRQYLYEGLDDLPTVLSSASGGSETAQKIKENWESRIKKY